MVARFLLGFALFTRLSVTWIDYLNADSKACYLCDFVPLFPYL